MDYLPLVGTKLVAPLPRRALRRQRLLERLAPKAGVKLHVLSAEPGYGKTSLIAEALTESKRPVVWYRLDPKDVDPTLFIRYMLVGANRTLPGFGERALWRLKRIGTRAVAEQKAFWRGFLAELDKEAPAGLSFVLDDFHTVDGSPQIRELLQDFIELMPENVTLYLATRERPQLPLGKQRARGKLMLLDRQDLQFTAEEVREYLRLEGIQLSMEQAVMLARETEGCISALALLSSNLSGLRNGNAKSQRPSLESLFSSREIAGFLSREVFERVSEEFQGFLLRTSLLNTIYPSVADRAFGRDDSARLLHEAEDKQLFIDRVSEGPAAFVLSPLFRRFLNERLLGTLGKEGISELHRLWGDALEKEAHFEEALHHYLEGGEMAEAARLVQTLSETYLAAGRTEMVLRWLDRLVALPEKEVAAMETLRSRAYYCLAQFPAAERSGRNALDMTRVIDDPEMEFEAATALGEALMGLGRWDEGTSLLEGALKKAATPAGKSRALTLLGCSFLARCVWREAAGYFDAALSLVDASQNVEQARIRGFLGVASWWKGDFVQAGRRMASAVSYLRHTDQRLLQVRALNNLTFCLSGQAKYGQARRLNREALDLCSRYGLEPERASALDNLGHLQAAFGKYAAAEESYAAALAFFTQAQNISEQVFVLNHLASSLRRKGDVENALKYQRQACKLAEGTNMPYSGALSHENLGLLLSQFGDETGAQKHWNIAQDIIDERELGYLSFRLDCFRALKALRSGATGEALGQLQACLQTAKRHQYHHFLVQEGKANLAFLAQAFDSGIERDYLGFLLQKIGETALHALPAWLESEDGSEREAALRLLRMIPRAHLPEFLRRYVQKGKKRTKGTVRGSVGRHFDAEEGRFELTARELQIARLVSEGLSNREVAEKLFLSEGTVKTHLYRIFWKLNIDNRYRLASKLSKLRSAGNQGAEVSS